MTNAVPKLPGQHADEHLAHALAHREWLRHGCRHDYLFWLDSARRHVATLRAAGVDPAAPRGEDGPAIARHHSPSVADDGLGAARGVGCVLCVAGLVALVVYLVAIN